MVSLANAKEPLYLSSRGANRPSHEGVIPLYDRAIAPCRKAGFTDILLRGAPDYALTTEFDRWDDDGVQFVFDPTPGPTWWNVPPGWPMVSTATSSTTPSGRSRRHHGGAPPT